VKRKTVAPPSIFKSEPYGFSQGVLVEEGKRMLFVSGQLAAVKDGKFVGGSFTAQCVMALNGIEAVLKEAGASRWNVVKITAYVTDMQGSIDEFVRLTRKYFGGEYPASTLVEVAGLAFPGQVVEIEATAII
jgi:2-iminobutanoate/2-iminopropanoate deaminase